MPCVRLSVSSTTIQVGDTYAARIVALRQAPCKTLVYVDNDVSSWSQPGLPVVLCSRSPIRLPLGLICTGLLRRAGMLLLERAQDLRARSSHCWLLVLANGSQSPASPPLRHVVVQRRDSRECIAQATFREKTKKRHNNALFGCRHSCSAVTDPYTFTAHDSCALVISP